MDYLLEAAEWLQTSGATAGAGAGAGGLAQEMLLEAVGILAEDDANDGGTERPSRGLRLWR